MKGTTSPEYLPEKKQVTNLLNIFSGVCTNYNHTSLPVIAMTIPAVNVLVTGTGATQTLWENQETRHSLIEALGGLIVDDQRKLKLRTWYFARLSLLSLPRNSFLIALSLPPRGQAHANLQGKGGGGKD